VSVAFGKISKEDALEALFAEWSPRVLPQFAALGASLGRVTAGNVLSRNSQPVFRASEMDGVAVDSGAFAASAPDTAAFRPGRDYQRADTGDDFDDRFDAVIPIEDVTFLPGGGFKLTDGLEITAGMNVEPRGFSLAEGDVLLPDGWKIRPCDIQALARGGIRRVRVRRRPAIAFIPTGDELVSEGRKPGRGQAVDANSSLARHMLREMGARQILYPIVRDAEKDLEAALDSALGRADVVLINGGSSKGHADFNAELIKRRGVAICHGVSTAPGRPVCVCVIDGKPVINVPGPPFAAYCVFDWCVRAVVARALGVKPKRRRVVRAALTSDLKTPQGIEFYNRIKLRDTENGYEATPVPLYRDGGPYFAGIASGQFISPPDGGPYRRGSVIDVELLYEPEYL
jgi:molybdopterin molybdotransferase/putative molybdopterin biosynthesis protein